MQAQKLGIVGPQTDAPVELSRALQMMWADNGDAISRQVQFLVLFFHQNGIVYRIFASTLLFFRLLLSYLKDVGISVTLFHVIIINFECNSTNSMPCLSI